MATDVCKVYGEAHTFPSADLNYVTPVGGVGMCHNSSCVGSCFLQNGVSHAGEMHTILIVLSSAKI